MEKRYSLLQVLSVLSQLKSRGDMTPLLLVLREFDDFKEDSGYTFEEVENAYNEAQSSAKRYYRSLADNGDEGAKEILDSFDRDLGFNMRQAFDFLLEYRTTNEKVRDLMEASDMTLDQMVAKSKDFDPKKKGIAKKGSYYAVITGSAAANGNYSVRYTK